MSTLQKLDALLKQLQSVDDQKISTNTNNTNATLPKPKSYETLSISFTQKQLPGWSYSFDIANILHSERSQFQDLKIVDTPIFDRCLLIDGQIQSSVKDEFIYHEALVHPAMLIHPNPVNVFIGGGGECATAREVLKYSSVQKLIICDIDKSVINISKKYLPSMYGADDKRCEIVIQDAKQYIEEYNGVFDVIIMDICDPIEAGPGIVCYFKEFYESVIKKLSKNGVFVTQSTASGLILHHECFTVIVNTLSNVFKGVYPYSAYIPSFYTQWGYTLAFNSVKPNWFDDKDKIDQILKNKLGNTGFHSLKYYDGETHLKMFNLPKFLRIALQKETRVMTKATPYYQT